MPLPKKVRSLEELGGPNQVDVEVTTSKCFVKIPTFDGSRDDADVWVRKARLFLEDSKLQGRRAVRALVSELTGEADKWFGRLDPSPDCPDKLFQKVNARFRGADSQLHPAKLFLSAVVRGKKHDQGWQDFLLELQDLEGYTASP